MKHTEPLRTCKICGVKAHTDEELELFSKCKGCSYGRNIYCKSCHNKYNRERRKRNKHQYIEKNRAYRCKNIYGITLNEYYKRMATSDCCEVCGNKENLGYDHDHKTMKFRGVLCTNCNKAIGQLGDTIESVQKALDYLKGDKNG
tara:strand:- start:1435 stop:1869 length:435 start_codon:yes stop_codon:yes gene_type:complete